MTDRIKKGLNSVRDIEKGFCDPEFSFLYGKENLDFHRQRWEELAVNYSRLEKHGVPRLFSAPGRTELAGNHTDHNQGIVMAASVHLDTIAIVTPSENNLVQIFSEGFPSVKVDVRTLDRVESEVGKTDALVRGIAASLVRRGGSVGGFTAVTSSRVLKGAGLSSSAALEILTGVIFNALYNGNRFTMLELAVMGKEAENLYFDKPCGLMDQIACAVGGVSVIDFFNSNSPSVETLPIDFKESGYTLAIVDTGGNHADLTPDYAAIPFEMKEVSIALGGNVLRDVSMESLLSSIKSLRSGVGDRAVLRAFHFYKENERVKIMAKALREGKIDAFLEGVRCSGNSSFRYLQNVYTSSNAKEQGLSIALAFTEHFLNGEGSYRVHGGGFAGTIQVYIPNSRFQEYRTFMEGIFGSESVVPLSIRPVPAGELDFSLDRLQ